MGTFQFDSNLNKCKWFGIIILIYCLFRDHKREDSLTKYKNGENIMADQDLGNTQFFKVEVEPETGVKKVLSVVYDALLEKGYNPVNQIVGYIMSGDPTYITSHKGARSLIMKVERDELVEEMLTEYIKSNDWAKK